MCHGSNDAPEQGKKQGEFGVANRAEVHFVGVLGAVRCVSQRLIPHRRLVDMLQSLAEHPPRKCSTRKRRPFVIHHPASSLVGCQVENRRMEHDQVTPAEKCKTHPEESRPPCRRRRQHNGRQKQDDAQRISQHRPERRRIDQRVCRNRDDPRGPKEKPEVELQLNRPLPNTLTQLRSDPCWNERGKMLKQWLSRATLLI
jgi:hypothetical protein